MHEDVIPSAKPTHLEPIQLGQADAPASSALDAPPDIEFDVLTDLFIGDAVLSPHSETQGEAQCEAQGNDSAMLRFVPEYAPEVRANDQTPTAPTRRAHRTSKRPAFSLVSEASEPCVTALVLGHLPVFASAWANQYARHIAASSGAPVAVLRVRGGYAAVDLVGADLPEVDRADTIEEAITRAARVTNRWVLRVGEPDEPTLARCDAIDELTLLTGVDEAAVVASYQTLKRFAREDENSPEITLAVMAASEEDAQPIAHKISRAAETFLERPARVICCIERITGGPSVHIFGGDSTISLDDALDLIREPREPSPAAESVANPDASPVASPVANPVANTDAIGQAATMGAPDSMVEPSPARTSVDRMLSELIEGRDDVREAPVPQRDVPRAFSDKTSGKTGGMSSEAPSGAACAQTQTCLLDGLRTLEAKCPYCASISLAIDAHGSLHLVADPDATVESQLVGLTAAAGWAADHMRLLALAEPDLDPASYPTRHLITRTPTAVRRLLDSDLRVHLLVDGPGDTHTMIPLNYA